MSDRTPLTLTLYHCPTEEDAQKVLEILTEADLLDDQVNDPWPEGVIRVGDPLVVLQQPTTAAKEIHTALLEKVPDCAWEVFNEPCDQYLGDLFRHTPQLGTYQAECDSDGVVRLTPQDVLALGELDEPNRAEVEKLLGQAHQRQLLELLLEASCPGATTDQT